MATTLREYLDKLGVLTLWDQAKSLFATKTEVAAKANIASPTFTGTPAAPTAAAGTNTTLLATTAFVKTAINGLAVDSDVVHKTGNETISGKKSFGGENADLDLNIGGTSANIVLSAGVPADALSGGEFGWISVTEKNNTGKTLQQALDERNNVQADWNQVTTTAADYIKNKPDIPIINAVTETYSSTAADTTTPFSASIWRVDLSDKVTELYSGLTILIKVPVAGNGTYGTLLRIDGTNSAGDTSENLYPVCANVTTMVSTRYAVGCIIALTFDATQAGQTLYYNSASAYTTTASGTGWTKPGCWKIADYSTGDTTTGREGYYYMRPYAGQAVYRYKYLMEGADGRLYPIVTTNQTSATSVTKTPTTVGLRPWKIWYYNHTDTVSAGAAFGAQRVYPELYTTTAVYNFNESTGTYAWIFLLGSYNKDTDLFTLDTGNNYYKFVRYNTAINWANTLTAGKYYILLGSSYSTTNYVLLYNVNPFYYFNGTNLIPVTTKIALDSGPVTSVNGLTGNVNLALGDTNVIESISVNGVAQTITDKNVDITVSADITVDSELDSESTNPVENQAIFHALKKPDVNNNGHEYVDLGLPSGTLWATVNIGASSESSPGYIREWGETTEEYTPLHDNKYYSNGSYTKYNTTDNLTTLEPEDDAAVVYWGGDWRMPTQTEAQELIDECTWTQEKVNGQLGARVTGTNGNSIFMPYDTFWLNGTEYANHGSIWTSTAGASNGNILNAELLFYFLGTGASLKVSSYERKRSGAAIRPVIKESYSDRYVKVEDSSYEVTYAELKQLRDTNQLIPGKYYRIIDYVTTTNGVNDGRTASACHQFDIIVRADDVNVLNLNAYAAAHAGDTYFESSDLAAWELKYTLDRDVHYEGCLTADRSYKAMICAYTENSTTHNILYIYFSKNTQFVEYYLNNEDFTKVSDYGIAVDLSCLRFDANSGDFPNYIDSTNPDSIAVGDTVTDSKGVSYEVVDIADINYEFKGWIYYMKDDYKNECSYDFKNILFTGSSIMERSGVITDDYIDPHAFYYTFSHLPSNVPYDISSSGLVTDNNFVSDADSYLPFSICVVNAARADRISIYGNKISGGCTNCVIELNSRTGKAVYNNIDSSSVYVVLSHNPCYNNILNNSREITVRGSNNNVDCAANINTNSFCNNNVIRNCFYLVFGSLCRNNIITGCNNITFGTSEGTKSYYRNIIIEPGNQYIYLNYTPAASSSKYCQNIKICSGVNNTTTWKQIDVDVVGNQYQIEYKNANSQTITV